MPQKIITSTSKIKTQQPVSLDVLTKLEEKHNTLLDRLVIYVSDSENLKKRLTKLELTVESLKHTKKIKSLRIFASGFLMGQLMFTFIVCWFLILFHVIK